MAGGSAYTDGEVYDEPPRMFVRQSEHERFAGGGETIPGITTPLRSPDISVSGRQLFGAAVAMGAMVSSIHRFSRPSSDMPFWCARAARARPVLVNYYKIDMRRLPLRTVWSWGPLQFLRFLILFKLLRSRPAPQVLYPVDPGLQRLEPSHDEGWLDASARDLRALGFSLVGDHTAPLLGRLSGRLRTFLSSDGQVIAGASSTSATAKLGEFSATSHDYSVGFWSVESNGCVLATSSSVTSMPPVPGIDVVRRPGANASVLLPMHLRRVEGRALRTFSPDQVYEQILEQQARNIQHFVATGLYTPATEDEVRSVRALPSA